MNVKDSESTVYKIVDFARYVPLKTRSELFRSV